MTFDPEEGSRANALGAFALCVVLVLLGAVFLADIPVYLVPIKINYRLMRRAWRTRASLSNGKPCKTVSSLARGSMYVVNTTWLMFDGETRNADDNDDDDDGREWNKDFESC